jgi:hypothetical protein
MICYSQSSTGSSRSSQACQHAAGSPVCNNAPNFWFWHLLVPSTATSQPLLLLLVTFLAVGPLLDLN